MSKVYRAPIIADIMSFSNISIAGFVVGALEKRSTVFLAEGTQMCSVLAIFRRLKTRDKSRQLIGYSYD